MQVIVKANSQINWNGKILALHTSKTLEQISLKLRLFNCVSNMMALENW